MKPSLHTRLLAAPIAVAVVLMGLAACGSASHNDADVTFAQQMVPHHEQALVLSELALDANRGASDAVSDLATQIEDAQAPEIEMMNGWLEEWGESNDDAHAHHGDHEGSHADMEGMASEDDLERLAGLTGTEFDALWLELMIAHHEGAVTMAEIVIADGSDPDVADLARDIIEAQQAEITAMQALLDAA